MTRRSPLLPGLLVALLAGCNPVSPPAPVKVEGGPAELRKIAGSWRGEFRNEQTGRVGKIVLDLRAEQDTAYGKITFDHVVPVSFCTDMSRPEQQENVVMPIVLRLGGLATSRGSLGGWVLPYRDPELSCWMDTWFEGRIRQDTLRGTFYSRRTDTDTVRAGTWWAARVN